MQLKENFLEINSLIKKACKKAQRKPSDVMLLAVSKKQSVEKIKEAYSLGLKDFGENYAKELIEKSLKLPKNINWHFIGHLQRNKVKKVLPIVSTIQSVDSIQLAEKIDSEAKKLGLKAIIFIEINIAGKESRNGLKPEELQEFLFNARQLENIEIQGLMCIAPLTEKEETRQYFKKMNDLNSIITSLSYLNLNPKHLSMGMSNDFEIAIEEGTTMIRIGTALFGERK
ncbi:MAG: YggS family pyridoxal phosphate-dependent enzyme [archaeon]